MFKEVGTSGQISVGKKYAGQLFDVTVHPDGSIVMNPVKMVPAAAQSTREWANANATTIDQYNAWAAEREPYSQRVRRWRAEGEGSAERAKGEQSK